MSSLTKAFSQSFDDLWRTALKDPHPFVLNLPSRGSYAIPWGRLLPRLLSGADTIPRSNIKRDWSHCFECRLSAWTTRQKFPAAVEDAEDVLYAVPDEKKKPGYQELRQAITHKLIESYNTKKEEGRDRISDPLSNSAPVTGGVKLDTSKIALSGFSSGGNLALEPALNVGANPPLVPTVWPSPFSLTHIHPIPLLLFYPSLDGRLLPSERTRPPGLPATKGFWTELSDTLAPTYLSREEAPHPRASPGLADILDSRLHEQARILLILPELDSLAEQSETWVKEVHEDGRGQHLRVERYKGMKHGSWMDTDAGIVAGYPREADKC